MEPSAELTLVDAFVPRLTAGKYVLTAKQTLEVAAKGGGEETVTRLDTKTFFVQGPRFILAPDEIYARFPPDGHHGPYHTTVPHVVFRRKALPWERTLDAGIGSDDQPPDPWVALLLFEEKEIPDAPFKTRRLEEVVRPPAPIRGPAIELDLWETGDGDGDGRQCTTLDISLDLFRRVAPRRSELRWLAHARLAATRHKEDLYGIGDGWFSVLLANRLPAEGQRNLAVLVSLEGHVELIGDDAPDLPGDTPVRLVVLDKWAFTSEGLTFEERLRRLYEGKDPWLRASDGRDVDDPRVATGLSLGYAPLPHGLRDGSRTVSWFRGPFVPVDLPAATLPPIFANPDEALRFDPGTGMLDASYAGAWQLGRLLAMQGQEFARALAQSESGHVAEGLADAAERSFADFDPAVPPATQAARRAARLEQAARLHRDDLMVALALEWSA
jgi:hypothetical protein